MTTIAFDGETLAADSQTTQEGVRLSMLAEKIHVRPEGAAWKVNGEMVAAFGVAGKLNSAYLVQYAMELEGFDASHAFPKGTSLTFLAITVDGNVYVGGQNEDDEWAWLSKVAAPMAVGSGAELAIGAMAAGANAEQAIEIASRFDTCTGGTVRKFNYRTSPGYGNHQLEQSREHRTTTSPP